MKQLIKDVALSLLAAGLLSFLFWLRGYQTDKEVKLFCILFTALIGFAEIRILRKRLTPTHKEV